ncbi:MAG: NAD(+)/NADH kinase [Candidatus Bathyarchaeia archaeon]
MFKTVGLVARYDKKRAIKLTEELTAYLKEKGLEIFIEETLQGKVKSDGQFLPLKKMETDFIITIGGDGTILRTCIAIPKPDIPILAINMGVRGFLTEISPEEAFKAVDRCLKGDFKIERCKKLAVSADKLEAPDALNEVLIAVDEPVKILYARIYKDEREVLTSQADGIILATQTGSTGYSLSAGGPVLDPQVDGIILTPICSLSVLRSIVFPSESKITVEVLRPKKVLLVVDGAYRKLLDSKCKIVVTQSKNEAKFIRFGENFYHRLRSRLLFHGLKDGENCG